MKNIQLTKAEEQVMQILWDMVQGVVRDIRDRFEEPKPDRNTVSTVLRVLEKKGYVSHTAVGNVYLYHSLIAREDYSKGLLLGLIENYFGNSFQALVTFYARESGLSARELEEIMVNAKKELKKKKKKQNQH